jgi:hypothetical protein
MYSVRLQPDLVRALRRRARDDEVTVSDTARRAISEYCGGERIGPEEPLLGLTALLELKGCSMMPGNPFPSTLDRRGRMRAAALAPQRRRPCRSRALPVDPKVHGSKASPNYRVLT